MTSPLGPKGPSDTAMGRVLQFRRPDAAVTNAPAAPTAPASPTPSTEAPAPSSPSAVFDTVAGQATTIAMPVEGAALSQLVARLRATSGDQARTQSAGPVVVKTAEGAVMSGSVVIDSRAALHQLDGVVRAGGSVAIEGVIKNADLLALRDLKTVEGRLTFESLKSV